MYTWVYYVRVSRLDEEEREGGRKGEKLRERERKRESEREREEGEINETMYTRLSRLSWQYLYLPSSHTSSCLFTRTSTSDTNSASVGKLDSIECSHHAHTCNQSEKPRWLPGCITLLPAKHTCDSITTSKVWRRKQTTVFTSCALLHVPYLWQLDAFVYRLGVHVHVVSTVQCSW